MRRHFNECLVSRSLWNLATLFAIEKIPLWILELASVNRCNLFGRCFVHNSFDSRQIFTTTTSFVYVCCGKDACIRFRVQHRWFVLLTRCQDHEHVRYASIAPVKCVINHYTNALKHASLPRISCFSRCHLRHPKECAPTRGRKKKYIILCHDLFVGREA